MKYPNAISSSLYPPFANLPAESPREQPPTLRKHQLHEALQPSNSGTALQLLPDLIFTFSLCWLLLAQFWEVEESLIKFLSTVVGEDRIQIKQPLQWCPEVIQTICRTHCFGKFLNRGILKSRDSRRIHYGLCIFSCMKTLLFLLRDIFLLPTPKNHTTSYIRFCFSYSLEQNHFP